MRELQTAKDVIDVIGGTGATARLNGRKSNHVVNWRNAGRFPADTYLVMKQQIEAQGFTAPASLWGIREPESAQ